MKRLTIPIAILAIILIIWLIQSKMESNSMSGKTIENFLDLNPDNIDKIFINGVDDSFFFTLENGVWSMADSLSPRRCDSLALSSIINEAANIKAGSVISQNRERQAEFMVDSLTGSIVQFYQGDELLSEVVIGKLAPNQTHTYIRKVDSDDVYLAEGMLSYTFIRQRTQWLDKTILNLNPDFLISVEVIHPNSSFNLTLHDSLYYVSKRPYRDSVLADSNSAKLYFHRASDIMANDFSTVIDNGLINFDKPALIIRLTQYDGVVHTVEFAELKEGNNRIYCRKPGYDEIYVIYQSRFGNLNRNFDRFLP